MIRPGEEWGRPSAAAPDLEVVGGDVDLARATANHFGALIRYRAEAGSDLAGAVGLRAGVGGGAGVELGVEVTLDLLDAGEHGPAVNMIVVGSPPDASRRFVRRFGANVRIDGRPVFHGPCTAVVIATGQFRRGLDLVPRGHPGDGRAEVQVYAVPGRERRQLRARLATGTHVPHPAITQRSGAKVAVTTDHPVPLEIDGRARNRSDIVTVDVAPNAYRLLL